ncbi:hypothetical protein RJT34_14062 [Clitoria ternatea]|uniref:MSP domain-containing protein n=1 Tax=Clitoria ternatea TaxID=43366 RepID=A0AAN9JRT6_CLITE
MATELLQIQPPQLTFVFELNKQSSCLVHLANNTPHHVAFKVKTTSPKKYCVRPTIAIINPHSTCDFAVTMQAQRTALPDLHCKDKFLIQSTVVPVGTTEDQISSDLFVKDSGRHVEEKKLRVVLLSPPSSPLNGQHSPNLIPVQNNKLQNGAENRLSSLTVSEEKGLLTEQGMEESRAGEDIVKKVGDMKQVNDAAKLSLAKDSEELKSRLSVMDSKLREAERTIIKLKEERRRDIREKDLLKQELEMLKKIKMKRTQEGFPLLFVCVVALVSVAVGYYIHP